jgi:Phosphoglycerate dehydrogenase and related dehydrogenases
MDVYFYDVVTKLPLGNAKQVSSMPELLGMCDIVTLHVPELPSTKNMMGATQFDQIKQDAIFINAARGTVVDIDALCEALKAANCWAPPSTYSRSSRAPTMTSSSARCVSSTM